MPLGLGQPPAETWHRVRSDSRRLAHGRDPVQIAEYGRRRRDHGRRDLGAICPDCPERSRPDAESDGSRPDAGTATAVWDAERRPCSVSWIDRPCCNDQFSDAVTAPATRWPTNRGTSVPLDLRILECCAARDRRVGRLVGSVADGFTRLAERPHFKDHEGTQDERWHGDLSSVLSPPSVGMPAKRMSPATARATLIPPTLRSRKRK